MANISAIPSARISDLFVRNRLLTQLRQDQVALLQLQTQLSTGRRIETPGDDVPAASRAIAIQRLLELRQQHETNITTNQAFLGATDTALSDVASQVDEARAAALAALNTGAGSADRQAAIVTANNVLQSLIQVGNKQFRGRYLFSGSAAQSPAFANAGGGVLFTGNAERFQSYSDTRALFDTSVSGNEVFGAISTPVQGSTDFNRRLTPQTLLADLNGGSGISGGVIRISDGTSTRDVDLSGAETIGDVKAILESQPPAGRAVSVTITPTRLEISLDSGGGGNLTIGEINGGTTADALRILSSANIGTGPLIGGDLNPQVTPTTQLDDLFGVRATAAIRPGGLKNNLIVEAADRGPAFNGVAISFVDGGVGALGNESAVYDDSNPLAKTLTITIASGLSTANQVIAAVAAEGTFSASLDTTEFGNDGSGKVSATLADPLATGVTAGGNGIEFDQAAGLRIQTGTASHSIDISAARTVEDLLNVLNHSPAGVLAEINAEAKGVSLRSRTSGLDFAVGENGGATATQLGLRTLHAGTALAELNFGRGVRDVAGDDFTIRRKDGGLIGVDIAGAVTIGDVLDRINNDLANVVPKVTARLAAFGNGIELVTDDPANVATFAVLSSGPAAEELGLVPPGSTTSAPAVVTGATHTLTGRDANPQEVKGLFTAMVRLRDAITSGKNIDIERAVTLLDEATLEMTVARAELGARQRNLDLITDRLGAEEVGLKASLSQDIDADLVQVVSDLASRQASLQAQLQLIAQVSRLTILDYL